MKDYLKRGSWNAVCDVCGFKFKAEDLRDRWDGYKVCTKDFELRHPQDLIQIPKDNPSVPWSRPDPDTSGYIICSLTGSQAIAGVGISGCARAGYRIP